MGIAPVTFSQNEYTFSRRKFICNIVFLTCLVGVGLHALFSDYKNTFRGKSVRMKTRTAIVVTFLEILLSMVVVASGIIGAPFIFKKIIQIDRILKKVDDVLQTECNFFVFTLFISYVLVHHIVLIFVDVRFWFNLTPYSWSYAVCYVYFFIEVAIESQFALIAMNILYRFRKINEHLANNFQLQEFDYRLMNLYNLKRVNSFSFEVFQRLHWSLCECMQIVNSAFGWQLLTSILCICIHIIVTPYFLLLDLFYPAAYGSADIGFLILQVVWIITHHIHLLLLVMPASEASYQATQAVVIICESLRSSSISNERNVLIGSVITYLVILIQFQNSDKVYH